MSEIINFKDEPVSLNKLSVLAKEQGFEVLTAKQKKFSFIISVNSKKIDEILLFEDEKPTKYIIVNSNDFDINKRIYLAYALGIYNNLKKVLKENDEFYYMQPYMEFLDLQLFKDAVDILIPDNGFGARLRTANRQDNPDEYLMQYYQIEEEILWAKKERYEERKLYKKFKRKR